MRVRPDGPQLISELVRKSVGADCSVLMGANIAQDIGAGQLSEATIGCAPCWSQLPSISSSAWQSHIF
jgi:glycerol-3-phosphate dehydrogenase